MAREARGSFFGSDHFFLEPADATAGRRRGDPRLAPLDFDARHAPNRKATMAEEEEKKGDDKGDHINLKVKDQVRRQAIVARHRSRGEI